MGLGTLCAAFSIAAGCGGSSSSDDSASGTDGGSDATTGGDSSPGTSADQACGDLASARCAEIDKCGNGHGVTVKYGDTATCTSRLKNQCLTNLGAPSTGASPTTVEACAQAIPGEDCPTFLGNDAPDPCVPPAGTVAIGGACGVSAQCASTYCLVPVGASCGTCAAVPAAGDSCTASRECGGRGGLICSRISGQCVVGGKQNDTCDDTHPCSAELSCVRTRDDDAGADAGISVTGTCQPSGATAGAACRTGSVNLPACDKNMYFTCDNKARQCVADSFAAAAAPCGDLDAGVTDCTGGALCATSGDKTGTCLAPAADGTACDSANGPTCLPPARCIGTATDGGVTGTCTLVDPSSCH